MMEGLEKKEGRLGTFHLLEFDIIYFNFGLWTFDLEYHKPKKDSGARMTMRWKLLLYQ
jgi:hypothetical protein